MHESEGNRPDDGAEVQRRALWVFPVSQPPIQDGVVTSVEDETGPTVTNVSPLVSPMSKAIRDDGDVALIPALINPHTHLEFSYLHHPLGTAGSAFPDWIRKVIRARREIPESDRDQQKSEAIRQGLEESTTSGVIGIGEILTKPTDMATYAAGNVRMVAFRELISNDPSAAAGLIGELIEHRNECLKNRVNPGVSPHAPYTVSFELLTAACQWATEFSAPVAFHFAESPEERELLESDGGPFAELLSDAKVWRDGQFGSRKPIEYLEPLAMCPRVALIHGNFLGRAEQQFVAERSDRISVVYCPRTHEFFDHSPYPLSEYLDQGMAMAIGTDSRASTPDLSMLNELLAARRRHPEIHPAQLLEMVTLRAAEAIGIDKEVGSIQAGKRFDYLAIPIDRNTADPYDALFEGIEALPNVLCS